MKSPEVAFVSKDRNRLTKRFGTYIVLLVTIGCQLVTSNAYAGQGKLLATPGVTQIEGTGGSGIVPWASLAGYASRDEIAASTFATRVSVDDYRLNVLGMAINLYDRVEISFARQNFFLKYAGQEIRQEVIGFKTRLYGDLVYSPYPQVSAGLQYKTLKDRDIAETVGADRTDHGYDLYLTATKLHLGLLNGYNFLWTAGVRSTKSNQLGFLGYGGDRQDSYSLQVEASAAVFVNRSLAIGLDYRQKPNNLSFAKEDDWVDLFIAYIPNKQVNFTLAYVDLGAIAGASDQTGMYLSITGYPW